MSELRKVRDDAVLLTGSDHAYEHVGPMKTEKEGN